MGVFGDWAQTYWSAGLPVIPTTTEIRIGKDGKKTTNFPVLPGGDPSRNIPQWSDFCSRLQSEHEIKAMIAKYPNANLGLCLGHQSGLACFDIDTDDKRIHDIITNHLPDEETCGKIGRRGYSLIFKAKSLRSTTINVQLGDLNIHFADILFTGKQTVIPPSIHPLIGRPYEWTDKPLLMVKEYLPELTDAMVDAIRKDLNYFVIKNKDEFSFAYKEKDGDGRNNRIKRFVAQRADRMLQSQIEADAVLFDKQEHANPLFEDVSEFGDKSSPEENCKRFVGNILNSIFKTKAVRGYETKANGFFKKFPKKKPDGQQVLDQLGNPVMVESPDYYGLADYLKAELNLKVNDAYMYLYDQGFYRSLDKMRLRNMIVNLTLKKSNPSHVLQFLEMARSVCYYDFDSAKDLDGLLNMENGILDVKSKKLMPHSADFLFKYKLPHKFDPKAQCPNWLKFLDFVFEGNSALADLSSEIFGYAMVGGKPWLHKAFLLYGEGRNGKSTYIDVLRFLLGSFNTSNVPIQNLNKPFSVVTADGKLANIISETSDKDLESEWFKAAVSGEELMASHKGFPEYKMPFLAKFFFAANKLPKFKDTTVGSYEKLCIIPFKRYIKEEERHPRIAEELLFPEIAGIINWALVGLDRLIERKRLPKVEAISEEMDAYRQESDSVYAWCNEFVSIDEKLVEFGGVKFRPASHYIKYESWCDEQGRFKYNKVWFVRKLLAEIKKKGGVFREYSGSKKFSGEYLTQNVKLI